MISVTTITCGELIPYNIDIQTDLPDEYLDWNNEYIFSLSCISNPNEPMFIKNIVGAEIEPVATTRGFGTQKTGLDHIQSNQPLKLVPYGLGIVQFEVYSKKGLEVSDPIIIRRDITPLSETLITTGDSIVIPDAGAYQFFLIGGGGGGGGGGGAGYKWVNDSYRGGPGGVGGVGGRGFLRRVNCSRLEKDQIISIQLGEGGEGGTGGAHGKANVVGYTGSTGHQGFPTFLSISHNETFRGEGGFGGKGGTGGKNSSNIGKGAAGKTGAPGVGGTHEYYYALGGAGGKGGTETTKPGTAGSNGFKGSKGETGIIVIRYYGETDPDLKGIL